MTEKPPRDNEDLERVQDMAEAEAGIELLRKLKQAKLGNISPELIDTSKMSKEAADDIRDAQSGIDLLAKIKKINRTETERGFCIHCGQPIISNGKFCGNCGNKLMESL